MSMMTSKEFNAVIERYLRPITFPVAVKMSKSTEMPGKYRRATKIFGHQINICQGLSVARRYGWTVGFLKDDMGCAVSMLIFGFYEDPEFIKKGEIIYPGFTKTVEAAEIIQALQPKAPVGAIGSIVIGALDRVDFEPDLVLVYGTPAQIIRLVQSALYRDGGTIESRFSGRCACAQEFIYPFFRQQCNVIIPAQGERVYALTADEEVVFAIPSKHIESVAEGLEETHKSGAARFPTPFFGIHSKPDFPKRYEEVEKYCGMRPG
jgi:uncharacterized protein (DUF169 family)